MCTHNTTDSKELTKDLIYDSHNCLHNNNILITGDIIIPDNSIAMTVDSNHDELNFTLTCISTGGPATTVTWRRDGIIITEGTETVLNDTVTAQYTHTLTGTLEGLYTCIVENNKSNASVEINVQGIYYNATIKIRYNMF